MSNAIYYFAFAAANVIILRELNSIVLEPYMDEPFHVPQAQAYCHGKWDHWDPKLTTPPGLYLMSVLFSKLFLFKCNLSVLRLTPLLCLLSLPLVLTRLLSLIRRVRPPNELLSPTIDSIALSLFPIGWFYGFLYYTDVPSLVFVLLTVIMALENRHGMASLFGLLSCTFRQTNIIWVLFAFVYSQLRRMQHLRASEKILHEPPALDSKSADWISMVQSLPKAVLFALPDSLPYLFDVFLFAAFVHWNKGIVLGDKSNHVPVLHIPQIFYFLGFATIFGWPALISGPGGPLGLWKEVTYRMFGSKKRVLVTILANIAMGLGVHFFTIHHPFLLADNRHYTFYIWRRVFRLHYVVPYLLCPLYLACGWAWFVRIGKSQKLLQAISVPLFAAPTLLLSPLVEPRYFLIPYILLRAQIVDLPEWMNWVEAGYYAIINWITMYVFLYMEREGVGRFLW